MEKLNLNPATLAALGKLIASAAKANRDALEPGSYEVAESVHLNVDATVNVGKDYEQRIVGKAKPWALLLAVLDESEKRIRTLAKLAGKDPDEYIVTLAEATKLAESVDPELVKAAQKEANKRVASFKEATVTPCKGKVTIKGSVESGAEPEAA